MLKAVHVFAGFCSNPDDVLLMHGSRTTPPIGAPSLVGLVQRVEPTVLQICLLVKCKQVDDTVPEPGRGLKVTASRPA
jgi:hypothetical protein